MCVGEKGLVRRWCRCAGEMTKSVECSSTHPEKDGKLKINVKKLHVMFQTGKRLNGLNERDSCK